MILGSMFAIIMGYLIGSLPSAYIAGRLLKGADIRELGDGNMGTANAWRELGARAGIAVVISDIGKGAAAMLIATALGVPLPVLLLTGLAAVAGHNWPIFLGFRGGRGAATTIGVLVSLMPQAMAPPLAIAAVPLIITRNVILAGSFLFIPLPLFAWLLGAPGAHIAYCIALPCLVGFTHFITTRHAPAEVKERGNS
jgi:glycerol-3-phosphate acyltransferase PlsY